MIAYTEEGLDLLHRGAAALAQVEANGIRIDMEYLKQATQDVQTKVRTMARELAESEVGKAWAKRFPGNASLGSHQQFGEVIRKDLGIELPKTKGGGDRTDASTLFSIEHPFVKTWMRLNQWQKAQSTYLQGLSREVVDGFLHPFFNLHTVTTYRSSSDSINFQNMPTRDDEIKKVIRRAIIPRPGHVLIETDYKGIEVATTACYHKDPAMLEYIADKSKDLHQEMGCQCYLLPMNEVRKDGKSDMIRYHAKNKFVFPQFYGDFYGNCAAQLWEAVAKNPTFTESGLNVIDHLRAKGIKKLGVLREDKNGYPSVEDGTFMAHIKKVERHFWGKRFPIYKQWKEDWYEAYLRDGFFNTFTGFVCQGVMRKNQVINYGAQGDAFHCLLWSLSKLVLGRLRKEGLKTKIIGQIHDSMLADVPLDEVDDYKVVAQQVMVEELKKAWDWIIVPLEFSMTFYPESWAKKGKLAA